MTKPAATKAGEVMDRYLVVRGDVVKSQYPKSIYHYIAFSDQETAKQIASGGDVAFYDWAKDFAPEDHWYCIIKVKHYPNMGEECL